MSSYDFLLKVVIVGDSNVGKSCLVLQFVDHRFQNLHDPTIAVEFQQKTVSIEGKLLKLQLWDTVGQENFLSIARNYYRESTGCVVTFDITSRESFDHVHRWSEEVRNNTTPELISVLVGTKADLAYKRQITAEEGEALARSLNMKYVEVSAKEGLNVTQPFILICKAVVMNVEKGFYDLQDEVKSRQRCVVKSAKKEMMHESNRFRVKQPGKKRKCSC